MTFENSASQILDLYDRDRVRAIECINRVGVDTFARQCRGTHHTAEYKALVIGDVITVNAINNNYRCN